MTSIASRDIVEQLFDEQLPLQRLYQWERETPERIHMTQPFDGGKLRHYTWRETADEARRIATFLRMQDWPAGSRIGILGKNSAGWIIADLAIWMAGHVSVPLYPLLAATTVRQIMDHSAAVACFIGKLDDTAMLQGLPNDILAVALPLAPDAVQRRCQADWDVLVGQTAPITDNPVRASSDLATIMYTSGTTGQPKGVIHSFRTLMTSHLLGLSVTKLSPASRILSYLPLAHPIERTAVEMALLDTGLHVFFAESLTTFVSDLQRARPTLFVSVPRLWLKLQQGVLLKLPATRLDRLLRIPVIGKLVSHKILKGLGLDAVRVAMSGSAPISVELLHWYERLGLNILEGYGMTELGCASHANNANNIGIGTVGPPLPSVQHRIDPQNGEVQVLSPAATLGYDQAPELTAELLTEDGWVHTGDKGVIDTANRLTIVGRIKDNFKSSKGKYVAPGPIEHKLATHLMVDACLVIGNNLPQPIGLVVLSESAVALLPAGRSAIEADFKRHLARLNADLDPHEQLDSIVLSRLSWTPENGMLTPTMKARRHEIEKQFANRLEAWSERKAVVVWAEQD